MKTTIQCVTPAQGFVGTVGLSVSVDGGKKYFGKYSLRNEVATADFLYVPETLVVTNVVSQSQYFWGREALAFHTESLPVSEL